MAIPYTSPFKLFTNLTANSTADEIAANRAAVLHRIQYATADELVNWYGTEVPKSQMTRLLRELDNYYTRQFHIAIFEDKQLLNFLEYGQLNFLRDYQPNRLPNEADFVNFIAPYFGFQYSETLLQAIKTNDKELLQLLAIEGLPMVGDFEEHCYQDSLQYINQTLQELQALQKEKQLIGFSDQELTSYLPNRTIELYNSLPDYFSPVRDKIGNEVYNVSVVLLQDFGHSTGASVMVKQGLKLKLDQSVRQALEQMLKNFSVRSKIPAAIWVGLSAIGLLYILRFLETYWYGT